MAIQLFKDGRMQVFNEYGFEPMLEAGWSLTPDEIKPEAKVETPADEASEEFEELGLGAMTKKELEKHARKFNDCNGRPIELDRRMNKNNMVKAFIEQKG